MYFFMEYLCGGGKTAEIYELEPDHYSDWEYGHTYREYRDSAILIVLVLCYANLAVLKFSAHRYVQYIRVG
jgi:hypothetical protein